MNSINQEKLSHLANLLNFGMECFECQKIIFKRIRGKKQVLFTMTVAVHNTIEAIYTLCKEDRSHSCLILLRTLYENYINAKFLFSSQNPKHFYIIFLEGLIEKEKQLKAAADFLDKNQDPSILTKIKDVKHSLNKIKKLVVKTKIKIDKYPGNIILDTLGRARQIDKYNKDKGRKSFSLEWIYTLIYRTLSSSAHLNYLALPNFCKIGEDGFIDVYLSGNSSEIQVILEQANYLYIGILNMFLTVFNNPLKTKFNLIYGKK